MRRNRDDLALLRVRLDFWYYRRTTAILRWIGRNILHDHRC